jgi:hypothetical protein
MHTYRIHFMGRHIGAIGIFQEFTETVQAENDEAARLKLYDKYEHIRVISCVLTEFHPTA